MVSIQDPFRLKT